MSTVLGPQSEEHRRNLSEAVKESYRKGIKKRQVITAEHRKKMNAGRVGKYHVHRGHPITAATIEKSRLSKQRNPYKISDETRQKIKETRIRAYPLERLITELLEHISKWDPKKAIRILSRYDLRYTRKYREWRRSVFVRDKYTCRLCGASRCVVNADHIKPFLHCDESEMFCIDNGRTLCVPCHRNTDTFGSRAKKYVAKKD